MVKVKVNDSEFYLDGILKENLDIMKKELKKDYDCFLIISGRERFGKSTLASQIAYYIDPTYNIDRCVFTPSQFREAVLKAEKYQAIVFDEAHGYLNVRQSMSSFNKELIKIMAEMGSKNLFIIICLPSYFELDRYPSLHRSTGLIVVRKRGEFNAYNYSRKLYLYIKGKKTYNYRVTTPNFFGSFTKFFSLDKEEYEKKKQAAIINIEKSEGKMEKKHRIRNHILIKELNKFITQKEIAEITGIPKQTISDATRYEEEKIHL